MEKPLSPITGRLLGELLLEAGVITKDQLWEALERQKSIGGRIGSILVELGYISETKLKEFLARQLEIPILDPLVIEKDTIKLIPAETAQKLNVIPVRLENELGGTVLILATSDPTNIEVADTVSFITGLPVQIAFAREVDIEKALRHYYDIETEVSISERTNEIGDVTEDYIKRAIFALVDILEEKGIIKREDFMKRMGKKS